MPSSKADPLQGFSDHLSQSFRDGLRKRREVLGDRYVDDALSTMTEFNFPIQKLATEFCWNEIWNRPGLAKRERSLLNLGMISALNRPHELKTHIRGALNNGVTEEELVEVFLQVAVYCGMPAGLDSFRIAKDVIEEWRGAGDAAVSVGARDSK